MSIHSNPSALAWTKFFRECWPECNIDDDTMHGWFANAMMAMHDHIYQTSPPKPEPLDLNQIDRHLEINDYSDEYRYAYCDGIIFAEREHDIRGKHE